MCWGRGDGVEEIGWIDVMRCLRGMAETLSRCTTFTILVRCTDTPP